MSKKQPKTLYAIGYRENGKHIVGDLTYQTFTTLKSAQSFVEGETDNEDPWVIYEITPIMETKPIVKKLEWVNVGSR